MIKRLVITWGDTDTEKSRNCRKLFLQRCSEIPMGEGLFSIVAGIGSSIATQDGRRVLSGIKADAEQVRLGVQRLVFSKGLVDLREVAAHPGAVICKRAARVDEGRN